MDVGSTISRYLSLNVETTFPTNGANVGNLKGLSHGGSDYVTYPDFCSIYSHDYTLPLGTDIEHMRVHDSVLSIPQVTQNGGSRR